MLNLVTTDERLALSSDTHYKGKACPRNHVDLGGWTWREKRTRQCTLCKREKAAEWKAANPQRSRAATARRDKKRVNTNRRLKWPFALALGSVRKRASITDIVFELTVDEIKELWRGQDGKCYWTGVALDFQVGQARHPLRPSLDRLNPQKGYTIDNVVWSSNFANRARGDLSVEEFSNIMKGFNFVGAYRTTIM